MCVYGTAEKAREREEEREQKMKKVKVKENGKMCSYGPPHCISGAEPPPGRLFMKALIGGNAATHDPDLSCNAVRVVVRGKGKERGREREGEKREGNGVVEWSRWWGRDEAREREREQ